MKTHNTLTHTHRFTDRQTDIHGYTHSFFPPPHPHFPLFSFSPPPPPLPFLSLSLSVSAAQISQNNLIPPSCCSSYEREKNPKTELNLWCNNPTANLLCCAGSSLFKCSKCDSTFGSSTLLKAHMKTHNTTKAQLHCSVCQATFTTNAALARHVQTHNQQVKCPLCPQVFRTMMLCKRHVKQVHHAAKADVQETTGECWGRSGIIDNRKLFLYTLLEFLNNKKHPRRWNVTASMVGLKNGHIRKNLTQNGEPQYYSWECRRRRTTTTTKVFSVLGPLVIHRFIVVMHVFLFNCYLSRLRKLC